VRADRLSRSDAAVDIAGEADAKAFADLPALGAAITEGQIRGRVVVEIG